MKSKYILGVAAAAAALFGMTASGIAGPQTDVAKLKAYVASNGLPCLACHQISSKLVGPAWTDVAKKYRNDPKAASEVADRIVKGGSGLWGQVPMPPNQATPAQAKELAAMILALDTGAKK